MRRPAAQLQRARDAPPRPELYDCDVCKHCKGGECARWRQMQREWVEAWGGRPPPEEGSNWRNWWKQAKAHHAQLIAAADAQLLAPAAALAAGAAGKRLAQPDGTPNKGGARKSAVRDRGEGSSGVHSLLLPPSHDQTAEEAEVAEVLAVLDMADAADAAAEATAAAEAAEVAEAAEAAESAQAAEAVEAAEAAWAAEGFEELPDIRRREAGGLSEEKSRRQTERNDPHIHRRAAEYDAMNPEVAHMFKGKDPTLSALARDWAQYFETDCDFELRAILAGAALEHKRRNLKICKPWLDDLSVL